MPLPAVVPVKLISFSATPFNNKYIQTSFKVSEESGIQSYEIQRKISGTGQFVAIGSVASMNSQLEKTYSFDDHYALPDVRYQYRLVIKETSGDKYSEVRTAMITGKSIFVTVTPNPADDFLKVYVTGFNGKAAITLMNTAGQTLYSKQIATNAQTPVSIDVSTFPKGIYILSVSAGNQKISEKIIIK
jgi:hypothetical protein